MGIVENIEKYVPPPNWDGNGDYRTVFHQGFMNYFRHLELIALISYIFIIILQRFTAKAQKSPENSDQQFKQNQKYQHSITNQTLPYQQLQSSNNLNSSITQGNSSNSNQNANQNTKQVGFLFEFLGLVSLWILIGLLTFQFGLSYGYKMISIETANYLNGGFVIVGLILQNKLNIGLRRYLKVLFTVIGFSLAILPQFLSENLCMCVFNVYGYQVGDFFFSSKFTRYYQIQKEKVCPDNQLCHFYATLPETSYDSVFFNIHTGLNITEIGVTLQPFNDEGNLLEQTFEITAQIQESIKIEEKGDRNVFVGLYTNLQPNIKYQVQVINKQTQSILKNSTYKTLPSPEQKDVQVKIAFGGDWSREGNGDQLTSKLVQIQPDVIMLGGDVGYDNGFKECYYSWDIFYDSFEQNVFEKTGRIIPLIFAIGNHDAGWNALGQYNTTVNAEHGPLYFTWAPQQFGENKTIPKYSERSSLNYHIIRNTIHFSLDSGYFHTFSGYQNDWMKQTLSNYSNFYKFAIYHVPIYPVCLNPKSKFNKAQTNIDMKNYWVPLFDQFKFVGAFENHVHMFKRTFPLKNNTIAENGTVYFGDGAWGVPTDESCPPDQFTNSTLGGIFEKAHTARNADHVWVLNLNEKEATYDAFTQDDYVYFERGYTQTLSNYNMN
ncbi:hypothetical protein ABPG72_009947 [Tetrahymena utriculariae]